MRTPAAPFARCLAAIVLAASVQVRAQEWTVSGDVVASSAPALPSLVLGGSLDANRTLSGPFFFGFRLGVGTVSDANENWDLTQLHVLGTAGIGVSGELGAGLVSAELDAGLLGISETAQRHQFARLVAANIPDRERTASALAPYGSLRFAVSVQFIETWRLRLSVEPNLTWIAVNDVSRLQPGLVTGLGVRHAF